MALLIFPFSQQLAEEKKLNTESSGLILSITFDDILCVHSLDKPEDRMLVTPIGCCIMQKLKYYPIK